MEFAQNALRVVEPVLLIRPCVMILRLMDVGTLQTEKTASQVTKLSWTCVHSNQSSLLITRTITIAQLENSTTPAMTDVNLAQLDVQLAKGVRLDAPLAAELGF
jgi:hypothetical protein